MKKETANKAAKWWADQLRGTAKLDAKLDDPTGMGFIMSKLLQDTEKKNQSPEQIDAFEKHLSDVLMKENPRWGFGVDYHPDKILEIAAHLAGLSLGMATLPWKTTMWIDGDNIKVACGYGSSPEDI